MVPGDEETQRSLREALEEAFRRFSGTYELRFDVFHVPKHLQGAPWIEDGSFPRQSLAEVQRAIGGNEGVFTDGAGRTYPLSLKPWADEDPETTFFVFMPTFVPDPAQADAWNAFWAERVPDTPFRHDQCRVRPRGYAGRDDPGSPDKDA